MKTNCFNEMIQTRTESDKVIPLNLVHISHSSMSETLRVHERRKGHAMDNLATSSTILQHEQITSKGNRTHTEPDEGKEMNYGHVFYVYNINIPFQGLMSRKLRGAEDGANCSLLCQIQNTKNPKKIFKKVFKTLKSEEATQKKLYNSCGASNQCGRDFKDPDKAMKRLVHVLTEPMKCQCRSKKMKKKKKRVSSCHCAGAEDGGKLQKPGKGSFYKEQEVNTLTEYWLSQLKRGVTAKTQSRRYDERHQRAGRESFFRERGTSGVPVYKTNTVNPELQFNNGKDGSNDGCNIENCKNAPENIQRYAQSSDYDQLNETDNEDSAFKKFCRTILERYNYNINSISPVTQMCCRTRGTLCQVDDNAADVFKKNFQLLLEPKNVGLCKCTGDNINEDDGTLRKFVNIFQKQVKPVSAGTEATLGARICGEGIYDDDDSNLRKLLNIFQKQVKPVSAGTEATNRQRFCAEGVNDDDESTLRKLLHLFQKQVKPSGGIEVTTQSRYSGGRYERAGREVYYREKGTSGAPKPVPQKPEEEKYEADIIDEPPTCEEPPEIINKAVGIGTNCKFSLGWYKDRLGYGEPKPQNLKMAIDEWNEVPLRQTGTKIGASLNTDAGFTSYSTNAATQSRRFRERHLRAGRETFYKEQQTSCVPKNKKPAIDGNNNAIPQSVQPPPPDRKSLRLGSDCSFCFEFYKDVPPESPDNVTSKLCDEKQNNNSFYTKIIPQWLASQVSERTNHKPNKSDASTYTQDHLEGKEVCECEDNIPKVIKHRQPLHIGSKVSYTFNFSKSISPKGKSVVKKPCVQSNGQEEVETNDEEISSECEPEICDKIQNDDDDDDEEESDEYVRKTAKEIIKEIFTIDTLKRLIKGPPKFDLQDAIKNSTPQKEERLPRDRQQEEIKAKSFACKAKCHQKGKNVKFKTMNEPVEKPDQPFRIGSSFSFDYNMHKLMPKQEKKTFEEKFPQLEDFSGSPMKMNLFRLIVGKIRKRVRKKPLPRPSPPPRPREKNWFSYVLSNIQRRKHLATSCETETKNFFSYILSDAPSKSSKSSRRKVRPLQWIGSECFSYVVSNLKNYKRPERISTESFSTFASQMLSKKRKRSRRRRRRGRGRSRAGDLALYGDLDDLYDNTFPESSRTSRTSRDDCDPCRFTSECRFKCDYKKQDDSTDDTQSTVSTRNSRNYATT